MHSISDAGTARECARGAGAYVPRFRAAWPPFFESGSVSCRRTYRIALRGRSQEGEDMFRKCCSLGSLVSVQRGCLAIEGVGGCEGTVERWEGGECNRGHARRNPGLGEAWLVVGVPLPQVSSLRCASRDR